MIPHEKDDSTRYGLGGKKETKVTPRFLNYWDYAGTFNELLDAS